ncbi:imm11 family protein [Chryseobacterium sp. 8AT]|uniref:imm11 family protein n=1 Tax=Chryseobacterium sp. 8AT TaxID=2653134 RepID=UPI0012F14435|nr:DUF1629 domain-containing protein [Chryseobacterium sp. 8AT]VXB16918.1 conserved hypothetical protein [Chryseobacterium sp. 8AT]
MKKVIYYEMDLSTEIEIVGTYPQVDVPQKYFKVPNNFETLSVRSFPETNPNLENFVFKRAAKLTDVLSSHMLHSSIGVFVDKKFKDLIENFYVKNFQIYNCSLIAADKNFAQQLAENHYFFLNLIYANEILDFSQSVFEDLKTDEIVKIDNEEQRAPFLHPVKLFLKETPDLFRSPFNIALLVSESLKKTLEEANISGILFKEYKNNEFYIEE